MASQPSPPWRKQEAGPTARPQGDQREPSGCRNGGRCSGKARERGSLGAPESPPPSWAASLSWGCRGHHSGGAATPDRRAPGGSPAPWPVGWMCPSSSERRPRSLPWGDCPLPVPFAPGNRTRSAGLSSATRSSAPDAHPEPSSQARSPDQALDRGRRGEGGEREGGEEGANNSCAHFTDEDILRGSNPAGLPWDQGG